MYVDNPPDQSLPPSDTLDLWEIGRQIFAGRRLIALTSIVLGTAGLVYGFIGPRPYIADATLLVSQGGGSGSIASFAAQLGAGAEAMASAFSNDKMSDLMEILQSRTMAERVIDRLHLDREIHGWKYRSDLVKALEKMTFFDPTGPKASEITIEVKAPRAQLAADIANTYVSELKAMLDSMGYDSASRNRKFIESRLLLTKQALDDAEDSLAAFQAKNHIASLPDTVVSAVGSIGKLDSEKISTDVKLKSTEESLNAMKSKIGALQADPNALTELEIKEQSLAAEATALAQAKEDLMRRFQALPPQEVEFAKLQRDVKVQSSVYMTLSSELQTAVIEESKESAAFIPLDKAEVPDHFTAPRKLFFIIGGLLIGALLGVGIVILKGQLAPIWKELRKVAR